MKSTFLHHQDTARCLWGPQHPGRWVEPLGNRAGLPGREGEEAEAKGGQRPWGQLEEGRYPYTGRGTLTLRGQRGQERTWGLEDQRGMWLTSLHRLSLGGLLRPCAWSATFQGSLCSQGSWGGIEGGQGGRDKLDGEQPLGNRYQKSLAVPQASSPGQPVEDPSLITPRTEVLFCFCYWVLFHLPVVSYIYSLIYVNLNLFGILYYCCYFIFFATLHSLQDLGSRARGQV